MTTLRVEFPDSRRERYREIYRINGCVCVNGSRLAEIPLTNAAQLIYPTEPGREGRSDLSPTEISTFMRLFLEEEFENRVIIN